VRLKRIRNLRYYTMEDLVVAQKVLLVNNLGNMDNASLYDSRLIKPIRTKGMWPDKKALELDEYPLTASKAYNIENRSLTCSVWFKKNGPGKKTGQHGKKNGTIIGSSGYKRVWRITTVSGLPHGSLRFEIGGRTGSRSIKSRSVTDDV
jgi:hypothetical protein